MKGPSKGGPVRNALRRSFLRTSISLLGIAFGGKVLLAQDARSRSGLHPPEPAQGPDLLLPQAHGTPGRPALELRAHEREFRSCLELLFKSVNRMREGLGQLRPSEVFSVQVYKETQTMERLVKRLKNLAKG